jgi:hypothetical protein
METFRLSDLAVHGNGNIEKADRIVLTFLLNTKLESTMEILGDLSHEIGWRASE